MDDNLFRGLIKFKKAMLSDTRSDASTKLFIMMKCHILD